MKKDFLNKLLIFSILMLLGSSFFNFSHATGKKKETDTETLFSFYEKYQLCLDTCNNLKLYSTVYNWLGTSYKHRTRKGKTAGLDCSGFAKLVYKEVFDKELTGGSYSIYPKTKPVPKNELKEGDLVFFKIRKNRISHVGIYLGHGQFAHAAVKGGVRIDNLEDHYYKRTFYMGGRL